MGQVGLFVACGIGIGLGLPCLDSLITSGIDEIRRGTISSIYSSMRFTGVAAGPPVMAIFMEQIENYIFYILAGLSVLCIIVSLTGIRPERDRTV